MPPRLLFALALFLAGCDACSARTTAPAASPAGSSRASSPSSGAALEGESGASTRGGPARSELIEVKVGSASISGKSDGVPTDAAPGFRHAMSFALNLTVANPGQSLVFEVVDRVAPEAEADPAHRLLELKTVAGKETLDGTLSFFSGEPSAPDRAPPRRIRLTVGAQRVEVAVPARSVPSRRCRASANAMKNPILYPKRWAALLFYAQAQDDRGLEVRMLEPPQMVLEGKTHSYPDWPEPGLLWRVRADGL
ncbi:MAG: hypothetical protein FJ096_20830 [Deltaproteobacteria bacterium]|nr:hypothetical protein [Deltaproteobacteria bacterium]